MEDSSPTTTNLWHERLRRAGRRVRSLAPFAAGILAAFLALTLYNALFPPPAPLTQRQVNDTVAQVLGSATPPPAFSARVYQMIQPSLVLIQSEGPGTGEELEKSLGSGVVISAAADILTSLHVVEDATNIKIMFADGTEATAQITATQPENDIAVLRPDQVPGVLVPAVLGNPNAMNVGDEVYVVGNPFGLYGSMSAGVVSGFERSFFSPNHEERLEGLIQIDAAANPGNSGGPLLNRDGQVVGIVVGILNPTDEDFFIGISFAVPIDIAGGAAGSPPY